MMITLGMDLGTQRVKAVILKDGAVVARGQAFSGFDAAKAAEEAVAASIKRREPNTPRHSLLGCDGFIYGKCTLRRQYH